MTDIELKTNESKYIEFIIKDSDNERFNLTDMVATIQIQKYGETTLIVNTACTITDATNGELKYLYEGNLSVGDYKGEIELTTGSLRYITPSFDVEVIASLPE